MEFSNSWNRWQLQLEFNIAAVKWTPLVPPLDGDSGTVPVAKLAPGMTRFPDSAFSQLSQAISFF